METSKKRTHSRRNKALKMNVLDRNVPDDVISTISTSETKKNIKVEDTEMDFSAERELILYQTNGISHYEDLPDLSTVCKKEKVYHTTEGHTTTEAHTTPEADHPPEAKEPRFQCLMCKNTFNDIKQLKRHKVYACLHPGANFVKSDGKASADQSEKVHTCDVCNITFANLGNLKRHAQLHSGLKRVECTVCERTFGRSEDLRKHMLVHSNEKPYTCTVCNKKISRSGNLRRHMRTHSTEKPFVCQLCDRRYSERSTYALHMRIHDENGHPCTKCDMVFSTAILLKNHMNHHTGSRPFSCTLCVQTFSEAKSVHRHMRRVHFKGSSTTCDNCQKSFHSPGYLKRHLRYACGQRSKSPEVPYNCKFCGEPFPSDNDMKAHYKLCDETFSCTICDTYYSTSDELIGHMEIHAGGPLDL